jgi:Na+/proline symporter
VVDYAAAKDMFRFFPEAELKPWLFWISAAITLMIGSIPQQDVFQRVMSAKNVQTSVLGPILGGSLYILFAFVPMFIVVAALIVMPEQAQSLLADDPQKVLPTLVMEHMPLWLRVLFFGAVLSAIMSTASATMLAPSTTFVENILKNFVPLPDKRELRAMRITLFFFALAVLAYALIMEGTPIYEMVAMAYQFPVVGAFWPLVCGLYWKRATTQGAVWSITLGLASWLILSATPLGEVFPAVLGGFIVAGLGMWVGSLVPTAGNRAHRAHRHGASTL